MAHAIEYEACELYAATCHVFASYAKLIEMILGEKWKHGFFLGSGGFGDKISPDLTAFVGVSHRAAG